MAPHLYALENFGVNIVATNHHYNIDVTPKLAKRITLYEPGDTVTENALFAAARRESETIIEFGSANYQVQEICFFLQKLGVKIDGIGTTTLRVRGVPTDIKKNVTYAPSEDPIEAMFFTSAALTTNSKITIRRVPIEFMSVELSKLEKMGAKIERSERYKAANGHTDLVDLTVHKHNGELVASPKKSIPCPSLA